MWALPHAALVLPRQNRRRLTAVTDYVVVPRVLPPRLGFGVLARTVYALRSFLLRGSAVNKRHEVVLPSVLPASLLRCERLHEVIPLLLKGLQGCNRAWAPPSVRAGPQPVNSYIQHPH